MIHYGTRAAIVPRLALCCAVLCLSGASRGFCDEPSPHAVRISAMTRYPVVALAARVQGDLRVECIVSEEGNVEAVLYLSGPTKLFAGTRDNLIKWRFEPGAQSRKVIMIFAYRIVGLPRYCPGTSFDFDFPNTVRIESNPVCGDHIPCP